jgi:flagella basal body P-ring formation protein FlgA
VAGVKKHLVLAAATACLTCMAPPALSAGGAPALDADAAQSVQRIADAAAQAAGAAMPGARVDVRIGQLDPRLKLAPCEQVRPYLPPNARLWGKSRIGLRCDSGPVRWNVWLPVTVSVHARATVAARALPAGGVLTAADLREAEVDLAAGPGEAVVDPALAVGRTLSRAVAADAALRSTDLKPLQWFAAGDSVRIDAVGSGYSVSGEGQALGPGLHGQPVRVRTSTGRVVTGVAAGDRRVEVAL